MSKKAFDKIAEGLTEAIAIARGEAAPARMFIPAEIDVKGIRKRTRMSQADFAATYGFSVSQVRDWEQGRTRPLAAMRAYVLLIERDPQGVMEALKEVGTRDAA